ncbi:lipopolysaccharide export system protein LptC [Kerstersia gyiorum]|jgi:lipopolysaccharide export system protein LptC|uniref:Lipopolysaccharide export system protein LptC n=2 Tax=Kerstersia gyiorum TaxID=206506 RepID=A0A4Q7MGP9_9BURK|nr:LPS export ABC transporter periplasmic protein LptC [Bordetella sp. J329]KAB0542443.1 LPS export ABC transporter periplasmic protein LptC [Kerstersia gyiorum]RZS66807.1 lipopolysaccharide export system protein LptC [Kerstersia gyiorum]
MRDRMPSLTALILLLALVAGTWWAADYAQRSIPIDPPPRMTHEPDAWAEEFALMQTSPDGRPTSRLEGRRMEHFPDDDSYAVDAPRAISQQAANPVTIGTANTGILDQDGKRITLQGQARLLRKADADRPELEVRSEEIIILPDDDLAYTDQPATVTHGKSRMQGTGMRYDNSTRQLKVQSSTQVHIDGENQPALRSPSSRQP